MRRFGMHARRLVGFVASQITKINMILPLPNAKIPPPSSLFRALDKTSNAIGLSGKTQKTDAIIM
jgi:hypothetical protein